MLLRRLQFRRTLRSMRRYRQIIKVLLKYGFEDMQDRLRGEKTSKFRRPATRRTKAVAIVQMSRQERIRHVLEELGPTFIKLGQMLSTHPELIPLSYIDEFRKLQDSVPHFPGKKAVETVEAELGKSIGELFLSFDEEPQAAASIAQVHRALLPSGERVAVKVQRPGIALNIQADLDILADWAHLVAKRFPEGDLYDPEGIVEEFRGWIRNELDFVQEAQNMDVFRRHFEGDKTIRVPRVHWDRTTSRVLTMECIEGIGILDVQAIRKAGMNPKTIAHNGAQTVLKQIFEHGFFHGDPHPGNLMVLKGHVIVPLDYGLMGRLARDRVTQMGRLLQKILEQDADGVVRIFTTMGIIPQDVPVHDVKRDVEETIDRYLHVSLKHIRLEQLMNMMTERMSRYRIRIPRDLYLVGKSMALMEGIGLILDPDFNLIEMTKPYLKKILLKRYDPRRLGLEMARRVEDALDLVNTAPDSLKDILQKIRKGELGINFHHQGLDHLIRELDKSTNRLSFSLIIASLIIASSLVMQIDKGPQLFGMPAFGFLGYIIAGMLGLWLVVAILRSGKM